MGNIPHFVYLFCCNCLVYHSLSIHHLTDIWGLLVTFGYCEQCCCEYWCISIWDLFSLLLGIYQGVEWVCDMVNFFFFRNHETVCSSYAIFHSHKCKGSNFTNTLLFLIKNNNSHSWRCVVVSHCSSDLHFPNDFECLYMCLLAFLYILGEMSIKSFPHFLIG